jgi:hypothetical protein
VVVDPADHRPFLAGSTSFGAEDCSASSSVFARLSSRSIHDFVAATAGLGPAAVGVPAISDAGDTGATVTATVRPRGSDVLVSVRYGARFEHATRSVRVGGEADVPVAIPVTGLSAGRTRRVRVVAWSGYGVKHSRVVRLTTTDTRPPAVRALAVRGRVGQRVRLRFQPADGSRQVAVLAEVRSAAGRIATVGSPRRFRNIGAHTTYFLSFRIPSAPQPVSWCMTAYDRAGHRSAPSCARVTVTAHRAAVRPARAFG